MTDSASQNRILQSISARLAELGWELPPRPTTALASKVHATAVGPKTALAYAWHTPAAEPNVRLTGEYSSEGRNVLAATTVFIPKTADAATVRRLVDQFHRAAEKAVGGSYAARLLRDFGWCDYPPGTARCAAAPA